MKSYLFHSFDKMNALFPLYKIHTNAQLFNETLKYSKNKSYQKKINTSIKTFDLQKMNKSMKMNLY